PTVPKLAYTSSHYKSSLPTLAISGVSLGLHFSAWVWSISHTTLAHSLLCVSMHPIVLNLVGHFRHRFRGGPRPRVMETAGTWVGILGCCIMLLDVTSGSSDASATSDPDAVTSPTLIGDFVAFLGALAMSVYLLCGESVRRPPPGFPSPPPIPLWLYAFPVTLVASVTCLSLALLSRPSSISLYDPLDLGSSALGFASPAYAPMCLYLGGASGVGGHTLINTLLAHLTPTVVGTSLLAEPVIGGVIGFLAGVQGVPGGWTWGGGAGL
ncbi:hypothetical protein TrRE_jg11698, partial [Triparma retinervis]